MKMKTQPTRTYGTQQRGKFKAMSGHIKRTENATSVTPRKIRTSKSQNKQKERKNKTKGQN
jgi:hypothetical protein